MSVQEWINGRYGVGLALRLSRRISTERGYQIARWAGRHLARRKRLGLVRAARANQWVASGYTLSAAELDLRVEQAITHTGRCIFDYYHNLHDLPVLRQMIAATPADFEFLAKRQQATQGLVIGLIHMSNFDFVGEAATMSGLSTLALVTKDMGGGGYNLQNRLRTESGMRIKTASLSGVREAIHLLTECGTVITGLDRPYPESKYQPCFFGRPARLPVLPVTLAMQAEVPVCVGAIMLEEDDRYHIKVSEPIHMEQHADHHTAVTQNYERLLKVAEEYILRAPAQWSMFYPVWPEALAEMPA